MAQPDPNREVYTPQKVRIRQSYEDFFSKPDFKRQKLNAKRKK